MPAISVGSVEVDVIPSAQGIQGRLRAALVPPASRIGDEVGRIIGRQIATHISPAVRDGIQDGARAARPTAARQGEQTGGAFARSLRSRLEAAFRSMPRLDVRLSDTGVDADLARLRARLEALAGKTIGVDIDAATARAQAADIEERLRRIGAAHPNVAVRADTAAAIAQLQALQAQIDEVTADPARIRVETDGTFGQRLRAQVQAAEASLPNINLRADSSAAEVEIARLRAQLTALRDVRIGVDMDAATATARIEAIQARLQALSASDADVAIRVDTGAAAAQLAAVQAAVNRLDGQTASVNVNVNGMQLLVTAALAFGPAIIPALPVVAAGLGAVAAAAAAAGAGLGAVALVAAPAFKQIGTALQAQKAAQDAAATSTLRGGQASAQGAAKALQMAGAQQALATAERNGARQIAQAQQQVVQAKRAAADAVIQAAQRNQQAARQVQDAERALKDAQVEATRAQQDLTAARKQAALELEDLNNRLADSVLSQRDAEISLKEATAQRDAVLKSATATELDKQKAILQYDQAVQRLKEQTTETKRLKSETSAANKAGVEGSGTVRSAQDRLAQAQRGVVDQARAVRDAQVEAARTQVETARQVADAQQRVSEATANVAVAQQNAADAVASAQRQIQQASQSAADGMDQAAIAQAKYQAELAKLTPSARKTFDAYIDLRSAFESWSKSLQPHVMPIFTRALDGMRKALPQLTPFVKTAAGAIGDLQDRASRGFKSPWWKTFRKDLQGSVKPAITGLGVAFGNVFKGMVGVVDAFLPHMDDISGGMRRITKRFANWGTGLKGSPEFERFLSFAAEKGPLLGDALGKVAGAFLSIGEALAPFSGPLLMLLAGLAEAVGIIAEQAPWMVQGIWLAIVAMRVWTIAQWALNAAMSANPIGLIIIAIVALVAAGIYAFNKFPWFRDLVLKAWAGIKTASLWLWRTVLQPFFAWFGVIVVWLWQRIIRPYIGFMIAYWKAVASVAMWLWRTVLGPVFSGIGAIIVWWWTNIVKRYFGMAKAAFQAIAAVSMWLWNKAIKPAFNGIGAVISFWWTNVVKRYFGFVRGAVGTLGDVFRWLWQKIIKPAWSGISSAITTVWRDGIRPTFDKLKTAVGRVSAAFEAARKAIKIAWDKLKGVARTPVQYVVDVVYNQGIRGVWNKVAGAFGAKKLDKFTFARGGIMPGYTPGKDVHKFVSPTGGQLELSGGESFFRPEFTRGVGSGFVSTMNSIARSKGAQGVKAALAPVLGGSAPMSTDRSLKYARGGVYPVQRFADGGVFDWIDSAASKAAGAGSAAWNGIKAGASWLGDTLEESARAGVKKVVNPLLKSFPGMDTGIGRMIRKVPDRIIDTLFGYTKKADKKGGGGVGGPKIQAALKWAKTQDGLPYQWGGNGNPSWDCSGLVSAAESVIRGQKPHRRWATGAFSGKTAPPGWVYHGKSAYRIGITNAGVGHTAGTLGKTNIESRGGDGVVIGKGARGYKDSLFTSWYGFMPGKYDSGGYLQPGLNLAYNGTGRPEPVFTTAQANALTRIASSRDMQSGPASLTGRLYLDSGEFLGVVRGEVESGVDAGLTQVRRAFAAGRKG